MIYCILAGLSIENLLKSAGIQFTKKTSLSLIQKIPGKVLTAINQKIGFRFITKAGEKGVVNLTKIVPVFGGIIGGGIDWIATKKIAKIARNTLTYSFLKG